MIEEPFTTPPEYTVTINHPQGGHVTVRNAADVNAAEIGQIVTGDVLTCTLDILPNGTIWATIVDFERVPNYQFGHFALYHRNLFSLKKFGTYKLVGDTPDSEVVLKHTILVYSDGSLVIDGIAYP